VGAGVVTTVGERGGCVMMRLLEMEMILGRKSKPLAKGNNVQPFLKYNKQMIAINQG
jgi:hypothetical protein